MIESQVRRKVSIKMHDRGTIADYIRALTSSRQHHDRYLETLVAKASRDRGARRLLTQALLSEVVAAAIEWQGREGDLQKWIEYGNRTLCKAMPGLCLASASFRKGHLDVLRGQVRRVLEEAFARVINHAAR